jgi:hypothetical protein
VNLHHPVTNMAEATAWQESGTVHPYTCRKRDESHGWRYGDRGALTPTPNGWVCEDCDYTQPYATPAAQPWPWPPPSGTQWAALDPEWCSPHFTLGLFEAAAHARKAGEIA